MLKVSKTGNFNQVIVPIFNLDNTGAVKPNPLFHRPWDKLHSRCIEYPFAASQMGDAQYVLDVGIVKSDPAWIAWLESLPIEVHATDYDHPFKPFHNIIFHQGDARKLEIPDKSFDKVLAVSVIEHIGLSAPQVLKDQIPEVDEDGDLEAVRELARVLKPGGELIMTLPFGIKVGLITGGQARGYSADSIKKFEDVLKPVRLDYYEYQHKFGNALYEEYFQKERQNINNIPRQIFRKLKSFSLFKRINISFYTPPVTSITHTASRQDITDYVDLPGKVVWRRLPMSQASATHAGHIDGVLCGVWKKV